MSRFEHSVTFNVLPHHNSNMSTATETLSCPSGSNECFLCLVPTGSVFDSHSARAAWTTSATFAVRSPVATIVIISSYWSTFIRTCVCYTTQLSVKHMNKVYCLNDFLFMASYCSPVFHVCPFFSLVLKPHIKSAS